MRWAALELLISLSEAHPGMVQSCYGWLNGVVQYCLEDMSEVRDDGGEATIRWSEIEEVCCTWAFAVTASIMSKNKQ